MKISAMSTLDLERRRRFSRSDHQAVHKVWVHSSTRTGTINQLICSSGIPDAVSGNITTEEMQKLLLSYNIDRAQIMSGLCRSFHPTRIDTHSVGRISKPCRPLYGAESEMTHDADRNYREAGGKKNLQASSTALL